MSGLDHRGQSGPIDCGPGQADLLPVIVNDLDIVGALGQTIGHELPRLIGLRDRGNPSPYSVPCPPGAVTSVPAESRSARPRDLTGFLLRPHRGRELVVGEHVQLGGDAEDGRLLEVAGKERMDMTIDEAGEKRLALAVDHLRSRGHRVPGLRSW